MKKLIFLVIVLSVSFLLSCADKNIDSTADKKEIETKLLKAPTIDLSTPEKAIYSYQDALNWHLAAFQQDRSKCRDKIHPLIMPLFQDRTAKKIKEQRDEYRPDTVYEFHIDEMKKETETRIIALVKVRNVTPIPTGAEPNKEYLTLRDEGSRYKFILENEKSRWLISDIISLNRYNKNKSIFENSAPSIPWFVYLNPI